jgi:hypothetical protein
MEVTDTVYLRERVLWGPLQTEGREVALHVPQDILVVGDSVYVVDNGNDRLVVLDRRLHVLGVIGREGEGPGEFQHPTAIRPSPGGVTAVDMGNARFTEFDRAGRYIRSWPAAPGLVQFAMSASGTAYIKSATRAGHYVRIEGDSAEELGVWPHPLQPGERAPLLLEPQSVEVTAGDTVHVFDEEDAVLYKYGPTGDRVMWKKLPRIMRDSALANRDRAVSALTKSGYHVLNSPLSRDFDVTPAGDLLLLIKGGDVVGLLIDPRTYEARPIVAARGPDGAVQFPYGSAALVDSLLYVLSNHDVRAFRVEGAR